MQHRAALLLGSNLQPEQHLPAAVAALAEHGQIVAVSRVWQSSAIGDATQPDYCNAAVLLDTPLELHEVIGPDGVLRRIESLLGRIRDPRNKFAARSIDIDLCLFNLCQRNDAVCRLPNPDLFARAVRRGASG